MILNSIGNIVNKDGVMAVELFPKYRKALTGIDGFEYLQIVWWCAHWPICYEDSGKYDWEHLKEMVHFCFEKTELRRLWSDVDIHNIGSYRAMERSGFRREGMIRQGKVLSTWCDYYIYGLLKEDIL